MAFEFSLAEAGFALGAGCASIFLDDLFYFVVAKLAERKGRKAVMPARQRDKVVPVPPFLKLGQGEKGSLPPTRSQATRARKRARKQWNRRGGVSVPALVTLFAEAVAVAVVIRVLTIP